jgi:hypothetical protein
VLWHVAYREIAIPNLSDWKMTYNHRAGLFWASEGAVALGYPEPAKRGQYMKSVSIYHKMFGIKVNYL